MFKNTPKKSTKLYEDEEGGYSLNSDMTVNAPYVEGLTPEEDAERGKRIQRELIQALIEQRLGKNGGAGLKDLEYSFYGKVPGFKYIQTDRDIDGDQVYRAIWED